MNVFKLAAKIIVRHWNYLLIYTVALGGMSLLGSGALQVVQPGDFENDAPKVAVIDRDGSDVSAALADYALKDAVEVSVEDSTFALQDAAAKDAASYVLIVPDGFERGLMEAARSGGEVPELETVISYQGSRGSLMDQRVKGYVQSMYGFAANDAAASPAEVAQRATGACDVETPVGFLQVESKGLPAAYLNYASFSAYALFASAAIFVAVGLSSLRRSDVRRRLVAGPVPAGSYGLQVGLACLVAAAVIWAVLAAVGLAAFSPSAAGASVASVAVVLAAQLSFALFGGAVGFLLWQLGTSENVANGVGNILGLACSFFSGAWIPLSIMGQGVRLAAAFTPFYWATDAMVLVSEAPEITGGVLGQAAGEVGLTLLWAAVVALVGVAVGRVRLRERGE